MAEAAAPAKPIRRRQRPGLSCLECRRRKVKCNQARPCDQCTRGRRPGCSYGPRNSTSVVSTLPWALGKPESFGPSSEALRETLRETSATVSGGFSTQAPRRSSVEGSNLEVQAAALQPHPPPSYPTPTTSSEGKFNANSEITSVSGNVSVAETPGSGSHPSPWVGSDKRTQSVTKPTETAERTTEKRGSIYDLQSSDSASFVRSKLPSESRVSAVGDPITRPQRGLFSKTRLFGPSHWMCFFDQFERIYSFSNQGDGKTNGECSAAEIQDINDALNKCKDLARYVKGQQADHQPLSGKLLEASLPCRELCDSLVQLYIHGFEPVCRILHIPSFEKEYLRYWQSPDTVNKAFIYQLVLVLCIGASISQDPGVTFQSSARQWISAAQSWLSGPFEKSRLNIHGLQIHCLLLLARQVTAVESDLAWISTGTLLRTAMQMGFHHDPEYLPRMSPLNVELRRRLWATIMEMAVQSSLESGQPPLISFDDFNTKPPLNINDSEIDESTQILPRPKDQTAFTDTSLQLALLQSLRIRHDIASAINNVRSGPTYDEILKLDGRMMDAWRECGRLMQIFSRYPATPGASITITAFHRNLMEWMLRSYLLIMHRLPAVQASKDPKFYFSRKACLAAAFGLTSPEPDDQFRRLMTVGAGFIRSVFVHSGTVLCLELITQVEEDSTNMALQRNAAMREPLRRAVHDMASRAQKRVEFGENNVRGHMFYSMVIGQVEAIESGTSQDRGILKGARNAVGISWNLLKAREQMSTPASAQFDGGNPSNGVSAPPAEGLPGGVLPNGDVNFQDPGFAFENIEIPESWLFTDWDLFGD